MGRVEEAVLWVERGGSCVEVHGSFAWIRCEARLHEIVSTVISWTGGSDEYTVMLTQASAAVIVEV